MDKRPFAHVLLVGGPRDAHFLAEVVPRLTALCLSGIPWLLPIGTMINDPRQLAQAIETYIAGDEAAGDQICASLELPVRNTVFNRLTNHDLDADDIVQDVLIAMLHYLRQAGFSPDNPTAFVVTMAKNRCTNLQIWRRRRVAQNIDDFADTLSCPTASTLDLIEEDQRRRLLTAILDDLDQRCRELLDAFYLRGTAAEKLRQTYGLASVQAVYYRRNTCMEKARKILNRQLFNCQSRGRRTS